MLDSEMKNYKASVYGIIDAIGTLGGTFEIVLWIIMLFYGSIRSNLYMFSTINSLSQSDTNQNNESGVKEELKDDVSMANSQYFGQHKLYLTKFSRVPIHARTKTNKEILQNKNHRSSINKMYNNG